MEGKYTGQRSVNSDADIYALSTYEKERKEAFIQQEEVRTGEFKKNVEIYLHNFKINFKKGVPKFENCDTIKAYKKLKLFSNYYIPIEIVNVTHYELEKNFKTYTEEELTAKITNLLQKEFEEEVELSQEESKVETKVDSVADEEGVTVKIVYSVEEKIGTKDR